MSFQSVEVESEGTEGVRVSASNRGIDPPGVAGFTPSSTPGVSVTCDQRHYAASSLGAVHPSGYLGVEQVGEFRVKGILVISG
jgi:hypothetical protein